MSLYTPLEVTLNTLELWIKKWGHSFRRTLVLWILGWMFVAMWACFSINTVTWMSWVEPYGLLRLFAWIVFCLGLILVILGWGELFTWNVLLVIAWLEKKITTSNFLKNLVWVYLGNLIGSLIIVALLYFWGWHTFNDGAVGKTLLWAATHKLEYGFTPALFLWILCNIFVCLALWIAYAWKTLTDKVVATIFPITAFAALWFEHCVANMFYIPYGYILNITTGAHNHAFAIKNILLNSQLPVTIWNFLGWVVFVGLVYWALFIKFKKQH